LEATSISGGGAITERSMLGASREISDAGTRGAGAIGIRGASDQATVFGKVTSRCNFTLGGVTMVCARLSASGGKEMIACVENSGSAFRVGVDLERRVSIGRRYSEGE
jgi:hypothetical protein